MAKKFHITIFMCLFGINALGADEAKKALPDTIITMLREMSEFPNLALALLTFPDLEYNELPVLDYLKSPFIEKDFDEEIFHERLCRCMPKTLSIFHKKISAQKVNYDACIISWQQEIKELMKNANEARNEYMRIAINNDEPEFLVIYQRPCSLSNIEAIIRGDMPLLFHCSDDKSFHNWKKLYEDQIDSFINVDLRRKGLKVNAEYQLGSPRKGEICLRK